jgi:hypothetical protein
MRRTALLALFALGLAATAASAQVTIPEFDDTSAWERQVSDRGTVFYFCLVPACGEGSTVSINADNATEPPDIAEMAAIAPSIYGGLDNGVLQVEVSDVAASQVRDLVLGRYSFRLLFTAAPNPLHPYWWSGFVYDPEAGQILTIVSSSQDRDAAAINFAAMLKQLVGSR